jgi:enterochelin esterase-like enzyme
MPVHDCQAPSPTLSEQIAYRAFLPEGERDDLYLALLLHGRTDSSHGWDPVLPALEAADLPPFLGVLVDAPWSERSSWYTDSVHRDGRPVETALVHDLLPHLDQTWPVRRDRVGRVVGGYSMGGAGALRLALAHPEAFGGLVALSPAVYDPFPPAGSNARMFGAFGRADEAFDEATYTAWLPSRLPPSGLPLRAFVAAGADESLAADALVVGTDLAGRPGVTLTQQTYAGGHGWETWEPGLIDGLRDVLRG